MLSVVVFQIVSSLHLLSLIELNDITEISFYDQMKIIYNSSFQYRSGWIIIFFLN